jgi:hypothetical protein
MLVPLAPVVDRPTVPIRQPTDEEVEILHRYWAKPDQKARREAIIRRLKARLQEMLGPMGFVLQSGTWVREGPAGRAIVRVRGFRAGQSATLEISFVPLPGTKPILIYEPSLHRQLGNFVVYGEGSHYNEGTFYYAIVDNDPSELEFTLAVLKERALPWVLDHATGDYPDVRAYLSRPLRP